MYRDPVVSEYYSQVGNGLAGTPPLPPSEEYYSTAGNGLGDVTGSLIATGVGAITGNPVAFAGGLVSTIQQALPGLFGQSPNDMSKARTDAMQALVQRAATNPGSPDSVMAVATLAEWASGVQSTLPITGARRFDEPVPTRAVAAQALKGLQANGWNNVYTKPTYAPPSGMSATGGGVMSAISASPNMLFIGIGALALIAALVGGGRRS